MIAIPNSDTNEGRIESKARLWIRAALPSADWNAFRLENGSGGRHPLAAVPMRKEREAA